MPAYFLTLLIFILWLAAILGTILGLFGEVDWRIELFSHFRMQYAILLSMCTLLFVLAGDLNGSIFSAVCLIINLSMLAPFYRRRKCKAKSQTTYRLIFANILGTNTSYKKIQKAIENARADLVLLVEVRPNHIVALQDTINGYAQHFTYPSEDNFGVALLTNIPVETVEIQDFDGTCTPTLIARLILESHELTLIGMHPYPPKSKEQARRRDHQFATIAPYAAALNGEVLLAGDLNATSWSHSFQELIRTSGLLDSQKGFGLQPSWPASFLPLGIPIDHALHTPGLCVIKRRLGSPTGSDHRPIILDFSFKSETGWLEADSHSYDIKSTNDDPRMPK